MNKSKHEVFTNRESGILLPVSSLPSSYGIGTFGDDAYKWIDFLKESGQKYWQVLPLGPTSYGDSPYQNLSAFAGNPYFIDLDLLCDEKLLEENEFTKISWYKNSSKVSYDILFKYRQQVLRQAFKRFVPNDKFDQFKTENAFWLDDYALYMAIKSKKNYRPWTEWDKEIRMRVDKAMSLYSQGLRDDIEYYIFEQFMFFKQWDQLHKYANENDVEIIGDIPIYVALDSADVWSNKEIFQLDSKGFPTEVAGVPPDYFSEDGQLWGNPLYRWDKLKDENYDWWIKRVESSFRLYDVLRIDHFRGLESYYSIPYGNTDAKKGEWKPGPGIEFIDAIKKAVPNSRIIAEDLGFLTKEVYKLLDDSGFPGMKVLQFAFDSREPGDYSPYNYPKNSVVYTGTHDNDTIRGWMKSAPKESVNLAMEYIGETAQLPELRKYANICFIRLAMQTASNLAIIPFQDWLNLDSGARINIPSTIGGNNWRWRMGKKDISERLAEKIYRISELYGRVEVKKSAKSMGGQEIGELYSGFTK